MNADDYRRVLVRDTDGLRRQLEAYPEESLLWETPGGVANCPGNLAQHIAGNLQHYIGHGLGGTDYVRDRKVEFTRMEVPRAQLVAELEKAAGIVDRTLAGFPDEGLAETFPLDLGGAKVRTGLFLTHLCAHLAYHLGQVDTHRRLTTGDGAVPDMLGFGPLTD